MLFGRELLYRSVIKLNSRLLWLLKRISFAVCVYRSRFSIAVIFFNQPQYCLVLLQDCPMQVLYCIEVSLYSVQLQISHFNNPIRLQQSVNPQVIINFAQLLSRTAVEWYGIVVVLNIHVRKGILSNRSSIYYNITTSHRNA